GGFYPFQLGRLQRAADINPVLAETMQRSPVDYLDNMVFDTVIFEPHAVEFLIQVVGAERVVLGTDQPFLLSDLTLTRMDELDEATRRLLLEQNAKRAFNLGD
ncbi:MAG: amidohydrolase family protein, partial [Solirubrobacterales bacterium]